MKLTFYTSVVAFLLLALTAGLFFPKLMDYDAAEYAGIAMHMEQNGDWSNIINRSYDDGKPYDYLDKPHVLFWSAWPGFKIFGIGHAGYRFGSVLMSLIAAFACYQLGNLLYNKQVGKTSAFLFLSAQAILLANHDVRTDSLLTSFIVLAVWKLVAFVQTKRWVHLVWAGAFLAGGVGTKGLIALLVAASVIFFYLLAKRAWQTLFNIRWAIVVVSFFVFLSPILYLYYQQFDAHPEKFVNGQYGISGVRFLLWTQSFERYAGDRAFVNNPEFSFFFHTLLWAILPWSLLLYAGVFSRLRELWRTRGGSFFSREQATFLGVWAMFFFMSSSSFKLPHYINVFFPMFCIFIAAYLYELKDGGNWKWLGWLAKMQWLVIGVLALGFGVLFLWVFPLTSIWGWLLVLVLIITIIYVYLQIQDLVAKIWVPSALSILMLNIFLNYHFYPKLDEYQGGSSMAALVQEQKIPPTQIYLYGQVVRSFDFYTQHWSPMLNNQQLQEKLAAGELPYVFTNTLGLQMLHKQFTVRPVAQKPDYHITALTGRFLNPATRDRSYPLVYLVKLEALKP